MIVGRTGSGKSRFMQSIFLQHLTKGHGVCLIDPHHDLSFDTLSYLVEEGYFASDKAFDRLIYLDWGNGWSCRSTPWSHTRRHRRSP